MRFIVVKVSKYHNYAAFTKEMVIEIPNWCVSCLFVFLTEKKRFNGWEENYGNDVQALVTRGKAPAAIETLSRYVHTRK